jgi:hypothetical protein
VKSFVIYGGLSLAVAFGIIWLSPRRSRAPEVSDQQIHRLQEQFRSLDTV